MKKIFFLSAILLSASVMFTSCEKDDPDPTPTHVGYWKGKYGGTTAYPALPWSMLLRSNGTVRVYDGSDTTAASKAEGTYSISGSTLTTTYTYLTGGNSYSTSATLNSQKTFMEGTWGTAPATTGGGLYFMAKE